jgi:hypothetical protein
MAAPVFLCDAAMALDTDMIAKLLLLLGSDKPGEIQSAASALCLLNKSGHDLHDLAAAIKGKPVIVERVVEKTVHVYHDRDEPSPQQIARWCLTQNTRVLRAHELSFVQQMAVRRSAPTDRQLH